MANTATDIYDQMAPHYRAYSQQKSTYIEAVDAVFLQHMPSHAHSMLDVGAGDGVRGLNLAQKAGIENVSMLEPSAEMVKLCKALPVQNVWQGTAVDISRFTSEKFDVVTCLWNVMGHMPGRAARITAIQAMAEALRPGGRLMLDVNNRHNANAYGSRTIWLRRMIDGIWPDDRRGDVNFNWDIEGKKIPASGHLFTPAEIKSIICQNNLELTHEVAVDYKSGDVSADLTKGQLVFILKKKV